MGLALFVYPGVMGVLFGIYLLFLGLWALRLKPFYLYHAYNWQTVFFFAPLVLYAGGEGWVMPFSRVPYHTALYLSLAMALAGLLKQIELYGFMYLFRPADFDTTYAKSWARRQDDGTQENT